VDNPVHPAHAAADIHHGPAQGLAICNVCGNVDRRPARGCDILQSAPDLTPCEHTCHCGLHRMQCRRVAAATETSHGGMLQHRRVLHALCPVRVGSPIVRSAPDQDKAAPVASCQRDDAIRRNALGPTTDKEYRALIRRRKGQDTYHPTPPGTGSATSVTRPCAP